MSLFSRRPRRERLLRVPLSPHDNRLLRTHLPFCARLTSDQQGRLTDLARLIVAEKHWEGCGGLTLTDDMKLIIAAQAALLLVGMDLDPRRDAIYPNVQSILVYPSGFISPSPHVGPGGVVTEGHANLGEAHYTGSISGPVIVSWQHALDGGVNPADGRNLVLHEFAHKLDFLDGAINGTPPLRSREERDRWASVMTAHHQDLIRRAQSGAPSLLDYYGAQSPAEFFAIATESFFERGREMREFLPQLYDTLREYYGVETAGW